MVQRRRRKILQLFMYIETLRVATEQLINELSILQFKCSATATLLDNMLSGPCYNWVDLGERALCTVVQRNVIINKVLL